ncbi:outer membrane protein assembly factor BamB family protein [Sphingobacterium endophyticum]|uniref:outer membrane protein assembly factor BamB family protein n=1 Tax=Sphingobacterium endophyticum TaxID=2546448 RepID=UPI0012E24CCA|nr:PQQ-binding-like beta-propeller repeat protein [Sphingobacterium endophyticum]
MRNTIIVSVLLFIAVVVASVFYFGDLNKEQHEYVGPAQHLPEDTYLIASFLNDATTDNIFKDFEIFEAMLGKHGMQKLKQLKQNLLRNKELTPLVGGAEILMSFHPEKEGMSTLFSIHSKEKVDQAILDQTFLTLSKKYKVNTQDTAGIRIYQFSNLEADTLSKDKKNVDSLFYVSFHDDIFFSSFNKSLLVKVSDKKTEKLKKDQVSFFNEHNNRNAPFTIYIPQQNLTQFISVFKQSKPGDFLKQFVGLKGETVWNINFKQDALMLTGESQLKEKDKEYISLFSNQSKTTQRLYNYFPSSTMMYVEYSFSDSKTWFEELNLWQSKQDNYKQLQGQATEINKNKEGLLLDFQSTLAGNFAVAEQTNSDYLGFITIQDSSKFEEILGNIAEHVGDSTYRFRFANIPYRYFGEGLKAFSRPYFVRINDMLVMANQQSTIQEYIRKWKNKDLLVASLGFKNYDQIQGNEANVTFFINTKNGGNFINNTLKSEFSKKFRDEEEYGYQDFYSWSLQLSGNGGNFLSRFYGIYKSKSRLGVTPEWTYEMGSRLINGPYLFEQSDTSQFIMVQEQDHTVHAIHPSGAKLWSTLFSGRIVGGVKQLADRSLLLVTDRRRLYRFDTSGKTLKGFSTSVTSEPVASPTVAEWDGQQIILIPGKNRIMAYDMEGGPVSGWDQAEVEGDILGPISFVNNQAVVSTSFGRVYFFDQSGSKTKEIDIEGDVTFESPLGVTLRDNEYIFYATDSDGKLHQIKSDGSNKVVFEGEWNKGYKAYFENINGSTTPELITFDGSYMQVFELGDTPKQLYDYNFTQKIDSAPNFFPVNSSLFQLGITDQENLIYLFAENGSLVDGFPVEGLPLFYYGKINYNSGNYLLTTKRDFKIYAFRH